MGAEQRTFLGMAAMMAYQGAMLFVESQADMAMPALYRVSAVLTKQKICITSPV